MNTQPDIPTEYEYVVTYNENSVTHKHVFDSYMSAQQFIMQEIEENEQIDSFHMKLIDKIKKEI